MCGSWSPGMARTGRMQWDGVSAWIERCISGHFHAVPHIVLDNVATDVGALRVQVPLLFCCAPAPSPFTIEVPMNIHEYQAKDAAQWLRRGGPAGRAAYHRAGGRRRPPQALGGSVVGGQGPDPRRRARQGRRRQGRQDRSTPCATPKPERMIGMTWSRTRRGRRPGGPAGLCRGRLRHRTRALSRPAGRPRHQPGDVHRLDRRRHGDRGGGSRTHRKRSSKWRSIRRPAISPMLAARLRSALKLSGEQAKQCGKLVEGFTTRSSPRT